MDWREQAACREADPELFFPIDTTGPAVKQLEAAKQVCEGCVARAECLQWALNNGMDDGVWGGFGEGERRALKRRASRPRTPAA